MCACTSLDADGASSFDSQGANVQACVYFSQVPAKSINTCFVAGGASDHCMNASGQNACVNVTQAGLTCVSVGYVEEKGSSSGGDTCATDHSIWSLAYTAGIYSGSTLSDWSTGWIHNEIYLVSQSPGTNVCPSQALCAVTDLEWDKGSAPSLYVSCCSRVAFFVFASLMDLPLL